MNQHDERPNILWISLEDTSPRFGCYGDPIARTPHIDLLAAEGQRFPNAFSTAGVCAPSRSAIITGMYQTSIGTHHMRTTHTNPNTPELPTPYDTVLPHYVKTFTEYLRVAGYYCTNNQKTDYQFTSPVTAWDECNDGAHWRNRKKGQPFFSVFNPTITHESGMWPCKDRPLVTDPDQVCLPPYLPNTLKTRQTLAQHYDNLAIADERVGQLLDELEKDGLSEDTIVFLWSDHGEGLPRGKRWPYDAGIRIPLIVKWPGQLEPGSVSKDLVSLVDLGPTVLSLTGTPSPFHIQGQPFLGPQTVRRDYIFATRDRHDESYDMVRAVRDHRYKYIRNFYPEKPYLLWIPYRNRHPILQEMYRLHSQGQLRGPQNLMFAKNRPVEELYDLEKDPYEIHNIAENPDHLSTLERLRETLNTWRVQFGDLGEISEDRMIFNMRPGGEVTHTSPPVFVPITTQNPGINTAIHGGNFDRPILLQLHCATQGASIAYTTETEESPNWLLYSEPLPLTKGITTIRAKAIRIGFKESRESKATFTVERIDSNPESR